MRSGAPHAVSLSPAGAELTEAQFLGELTERTGCLLLVELPLERDDDYPTDAEPAAELAAIRNAAGK